MIKGADFVIIGAMKCATSTLQAQLARQPGFYMAKMEPNFFSDDEIYARGNIWYESLFENARANQLRGESSTHYTKLPTYPHTVERMVENLPDVRLIYLMRHPIDRLISQYIHEWTERRINVAIGEAIEQHPELISYSRYAMQLEPFLNAYGPENILAVFFDRLLSQPQQELERICRFVGHQGLVKWYEEPPRNVSNEAMRKSPLRDAIIEFPPLATLRRTLVPKPIRARIRQLWTMKERPQVPASKLQRLVEVFDDDLNRLGCWLGLDISCANFQDATARAPLESGWAKNLRIA